MVYVLPIILTIIFVFLYDYGKIRDGKKMAIAFLILYLIFLSGFQYMIGSDTENYMLEFKEMVVLEKLTHEDLLTINRQPLWIIFFSLCKTICNDYFFFKILFAIFLNLSVFFIIVRYSKWPFITILLYELGTYLPMNFETMRESIAVSLGMIGIHSFVTKKYIYFWCLSLLAFFIHISAIVLFFVPIALKVRLTLRKVIYILPFFTIIALLMSRFSFELQMLDSLFTNDMLKAAEHYANNGERMGIPINFILIIGFEYFLFLLLVKIGNCDQWILQLFVIFLFLLVIGKFLPITYRFNRYFCIFGYVCITEMLRVFYFYFLRSLPKNIIILFIVFLFSYSSVKGLFILEQGHRQIEYYYPYKTIFDTRRLQN